MVVECWNGTVGSNGPLFPSLYPSWEHRIHTFSVGLEQAGNGIFGRPEPWPLCGFGAHDNWRACCTQEGVELKLRPSYAFLFFLYPLL
jgi:hypothetical protein